LFAESKQLLTVPNLKNVLPQHEQKDISSFHLICQALPAGIDTAALNGSAGCRVSSGQSLYHS
jgi:hypothetical protein